MQIKHSKDLPLSNDLTNYLIKTNKDIIEIILWGFGVLGSLVFPLFVTKIELYLTGSITSKNKGGRSNPLRKNSINNPLFSLDGFPYI